MKKSIFLLLFCIFSLQGIAQKTYIGYIYPTGGCRGTELVITIGGQSIISSEKVLISGKGIKAEVIPIDKKALAQAMQKNRKKKQNISDEDNLQLADKLQVKITIDKDAELGIRDLKVVAANGSLSNRLFFEVGQYPNLLESEPNNSLRETNQMSSLPAVVCGQIEKGGRDYFTFEAKKGQTIVAETKARALVPYLADAVPGWFQAVTTLYDSDFKEVAYSDDNNLTADPTIIYKIEKTGQYHLEIKDAIYRGREDFVYRIALGEIPYVSSYFPLGWSENSKLELEVQGVNLGKSNIFKLKTPKAQERFIHNIKNKKSPYQSNSFTMQVSSGLEEILLSEDNGDKKLSALELSGNKVYNARIDHEYDQDWYHITTTKANENWVFDLAARRLGSVLDAKVTVYDSEGKLLKQEDDTADPSEGMITHHADPQLSYKFAKPGKYFIRITDAQNKYGYGYEYRLRAGQAEPDFSLSIEPSAISIPQGGTTHITVFPVRKNGFRDPIVIKSDDLPEGYSMSYGELKGWSKMLKVSLSAPVNAPVGKVDINIYGESKNKAGEIKKRPAEPVEAMLQAFYITHLIPTDEFRVDITEPKPFTLSVEQDKPLKLKANELTPLKVKVTRQEGYSDTVLVMFKGPMSGIIATPVKAGAGDEYVTLMIESKKYPKCDVVFNNSSLLGTVKATTKAKVAGQKRNSISAAVMVVSPFFAVETPSVFPEGYVPPEPKNKNKNKTIKK